MPKNLQNPIMLFEFITKNAKVMFVYYPFRKRIPLFDNSNK